MHRLHPAGLLGLGRDAVLAQEVEEIGGAVAQDCVEALARRLAPFALPLYRRLDAKEI
jgi:hypothetical protein